ncbi:MAG: hypothetical protein P4L65_09780 [Legionella sp.]|nr:hypothetical protein [Legionella sp.]
MNTILIDTIYSLPLDAPQELVDARLLAAYKQHPHVGKKAQNMDGETPAMIAAKLGHIGVLHWLFNPPFFSFRFKPNVDELGPNNYTVLTYAALYKDSNQNINEYPEPRRAEISRRRACIDLLIKQNPTRPSGESNLSATTHGSFYFLAFSLQRLQSSYGCSRERLKKAIETKDLEVVRGLCKIDSFGSTRFRSGPDINALIELFKTDFDLAKNMYLIAYRENPFKLCLNDLIPLMAANSELALKIITTVQPMTLTWCFIFEILSKSCSSNWQEYLVEQLTNGKPCLYKPNADYTPGIITFNKDLVESNIADYPLILNFFVQQIGPQNVQAETLASYVEKDLLTRLYNIISLVPVSSSTFNGYVLIHTCAHQNKLDLLVELLAKGVHYWPSQPLTFYNLPTPIRYFLDAYVALTTYAAPRLLPKKLTVLSQAQQETLLRLFHADQAITKKLTFALSTLESKADQQIRGNPGRVAIMNHGLFSAKEVLVGAPRNSIICGKSC